MYRRVKRKTPFGVYLENRGITKAFISRKVGVTESAVYYWVWTTVMPSDERKTQIADLLNVPVKRLFQ